MSCSLSNRIDRIAKAVCETVTILHYVSKLKQFRSCISLHADNIQNSIYFTFGSLKKNAGER